MKTIKKAKAGAKFDLNKDGKTTFKDVLIGRGVLPKTAKKGASVKKAQVGTKEQWNKEKDLKKKEMDLKKAELREKVKKIASSLPKAKSGIKMKKAKDGIERGLMTGKLLGGAMETRPTRTKSLQQKATDNVKKINMSNAADSMKKSMADAAKNGKSMKKCKYGCK